MLGGIEGRRRRGVTEDETVGWHHRLDAREFEQALGVDGQGSLVCYSSWSCKESDMTEWLIWTELKLLQTLCDSMDCSPPGSSVQGILQARRLEWVAISDSKVSSWPTDLICVSYVSCVGRWVLYHSHHLGGEQINNNNSDWEELRQKHCGWGWGWVGMGHSGSA